MNRSLLKRKHILVFLIAFFSFTVSFAQVFYNAAAAYSLRKINPAYGGSCVQVRRTCDNAIKNIGFTSCGDLDTTALKLFVVVANPLSSISTASAAAFSLRRLSCAYAGSAIQVRRSSDNTTQNIGFTSTGDLDTTALLTFTGANSGFVTIWYDQSGNARNASQATTGFQPRIVNAGVIERQGGMPAVRFLGIDYGLSTASFTAFASAACFNSVAKVNTDLTYNATVNKCTANFPAPLDLYNSTIVIGNGPSYTFFTMSQTFNASHSNAIWTYQGASAGTLNAYLNSSTISSGAITYFGDFGTPLVIGSRADLLTGLNGWISEVITFAALPSVTDRLFLEWTQGQYYSISGAPSLGTLPVNAPSGYIASWYDQSGSGLTAAQATTANQGRIINTGIIETNGTRPAVKFGGSSQNLVATLPVSTYPVSISTLANTLGASTNGAFVKLGGITTGSAGVGIGVGASGTDYDHAGTTLIGLKEGMVWCPSSPAVNYPATPFSVTEVQQSAAGGSGLTAYLNGTNVPLSLATNVTDGPTITGNLFIGGYTNSTLRYPVVKESEVAIFGSALSATARTLIETSQSVYYGNTISNSKYTPPASSYKLFVNGVGRESSSDSVAFTRSTKGLGFLIGSTATDFLKDNGDYITAGMDCPTAGLSVLNLPATVVQRWTNDWYINKTDISSNNGTVTLFFDYSDYGVIGLPGVAANYVLLSRNSPAATFSIVTVTSTVVSGDRVMFTLDASNITNDFYYTIGTKNTAVSPLPIELLKFTAMPNGNKVDLNWSTATETNNDYFTIEKTKDGSNFEKVSTVAGAGNSVSVLNYSSVDNAPYEGISYYRLKQTDFNGAYTYSNLEEVDFKSSTDFALNVYPNPNDGENVTMSITAEKGKEVLVVVYDVTGKENYSKVIITQDKGDTVYALDPSDKLSPGIYLITATSDQSICSKRLIVK